jgi:uncharacterized protein
VRFKLVKTMIMACGLMAVVSAGISAADLSAKEIMSNNCQVGKINDMQNISTITMYNEAGQSRVRKTQGVTKLQKNQIDYFKMIRFVEPADVKGTGILTVEHTGGDDDVWIYLPALKKSRRIVSSEKSNSFMGTEFSYSDMLNPKVEDYQYQLLKTENVAGMDCYVVESDPANQKVLTETGYSKKISWIRKDNFVESKIDYYDKSGALLKTLTTNNIIEVDQANHKWLALKREIINHQTKRKTSMEFNKIKVNTGVSDDFFTLRYLEKEG